MTKWTYDHGFSYAEWWSCPEGHQCTAFDGEVATGDGIVRIHDYECPKCTPPQGDPTEKSLAVLQTAVHLLEGANLLRDWSGMTPQEALKHLSEEVTSNA